MMTRAEQAAHKGIRHFSAESRVITLARKALRVGQHWAQPCCLFRWFEIVSIQAWQLVLRVPTR